MRDNKTSQPAQKYDATIRKTLPLYDLFHDETLALVETVAPNPAAWLDAGCGTGTFAVKATALFPNTRFVLADPAEAMLAIAREKLLQRPAANVEYAAQGTEELDYPESCFDVITAILAHHYFDAGARRLTTAKCFNMLKAGGVYVSFENFRPNSERGLQIGLDRWRKVQQTQGKSAEEIDRHLNRFGVESLPISVDANLLLLKQAGFAVVELFWVSGLQAGFYAIK